MRRWQAGLIGIVSLWGTIAALLGIIIGAVVFVPQMSVAFTIGLGVGVISWLGWEYGVELWHQRQMRRRSDTSSPS